MHLLIFRFSAMGDVALTTPVLRGVLADNPEVNITMVTRKFFVPFFTGIDRLNVIGAEFEETHKGLLGIFRLYRVLKKAGKYDAVVDLHGVIRSVILRLLFRVKGISCSSIQKDRKLKEEALNNESAPKLIHSIERYRQVFSKAGLKFEVYQQPPFVINSETENSANSYIKKIKGEPKYLIGIAPFAKHKLKVWPVYKLRNLIAELVKIPQLHVLLFGGGRQEKEQLKLLAGRYKHCTVVNLNFSQEIALIHNLNCMISMDSANMHIAALSGIPVISVWGATHPGMGFSAWNQPDENTVQVDVEELTCRPCTVYGKGFCRRGDFACMQRINWDMVYEQVVRVVGISM